MHEYSSALRYLVRAEKVLRFIRGLKGSSTAKMNSGRNTSVMILLNNTIRLLTFRIVFKVSNML